jgi:hypothetical protein
VSCSTMRRRVSSAKAWNKRAVLLPSCATVEILTTYRLQEEGSVSQRGQDGDATLHLDVVSVNLRLPQPVGRSVGLVVQLKREGCLEDGESQGVPGGVAWGLSPKAASRKGVSGRRVGRQCVGQCLGLHHRCSDTWRSLRPSRQTGQPDTGP